MAEDDLERLNLVARYRSRLDDIRQWRADLPDVMVKICGTAPDLSNVRGSGITTGLPGGDALAMLGPWAPDADQGDDLPHPDQIVFEWTERLAGRALRTWAQNWRWLYDHTPDILQSPAAVAWRSDINALWHRLESLVGDRDRPVTTNRGPDECRAAGGLVPGTARVTLAEADKLFDGIRNRVDVDRSRARARHRPPRYKCQPDSRGRYLVQDLRDHYGATPYEGPPESPSR